MVTAISGSGAPYSAPTATSAAATAASPSADSTQSAKPAAAAPRVNIAEDPSTWTWEHRQQVATNWVESSLRFLAEDTLFVKWGSDAEVDREARAKRQAGASEELISATTKTTKEGAQRADESLTNAKANLEKQGFTVTGTVYEKGSDGEWRMGQFTLDARRDGYVLHYDSSTGLTVTPDAGTAGGGAAAASDTAKAVATVKAADAADIYAQAKAQAEQYNKLFDKLDAALNAWTQGGSSDSQSKSDVDAARADIAAFRFDPWDDKLRQAGFTVATSLIHLNHAGDGRAVVAARTLNSVADGLNLSVKLGGEGGALFRHEGSDGWQSLDDETVANARLLMQQALTRPVNMVA